MAHSASPATGHPSDSEELGTRLRARRRELGLSQHELADLADVSVRFVGDLERGKSTVRLAHVLAVVHALGLGLTLT
ncbi:helix-turn-helix transcriptional regulator [Agromyces aerolatus]|uniref:helix-turn-helix transcriptional regulator n=1 Tax=Agromyces sp. LY-1074 TaxID=3074080 RepID=UPI002864C7FA|nr:MULTISPECIES: helix-turn-helix transcriptional regulator [unclassified Agromyces]MDR5698978.1 helix-turn-helix transcriptional regulator [Agromyces sp. LY-1074]MDR5705244.1 helix-turn-helix transcriptional regulator [Agromyces sp. LY-1358]